MTNLTTRNQGMTKIRMISGVFWPRALWFRAGTRRICASPNRTPPTPGSRAGDTSKATRTPDPPRDKQAEIKIRNQSSKVNENKVYISNIPRHQFSPDFTPEFTPGSRTHTVLPGQLGSRNLRPLGVTSSVRPQVGVDQHPTAKDAPTSDTTRREQTDTGYAGDQKTLHLPGSERGETNPRSVPEPTLPRPEEGRITASGDKPKTTELLHREAEVQDGRCQANPEPTAGRRLDGINRLKGCLPFGPNISRISQVPQIHMEGATVRIPMSPVWTHQCTTGVHQAFEASDGHPATERHSLHNLPIRTTDYGPIEGGTGGSDPGHTNTLPTIRLSNQLGQVSPQTHSIDQVPGPSDRFSSNDTPPAPREG